MNHAEQVERAENIADIQRGKSMLESRERIHFNELANGDCITGVGEVSQLVREPVGRVKFVADDIDFDMRAEGWVTILSRSDAGVCPMCGHVNHKEPIRRTFQGASEFYCDGCERFFQDFDYGNDE